MKKIIPILICILLVQFSFAEKPKFTGFNNYTKWVDKGLKDGVVNPKEVQDVDKFLLNEKGKHAFMITLPPPDSFWDLKYKALPSQNIRVTAKDNDTGQEWTVYEAFCRHGKINWFQINPIKGNITLTCTYLESEVERTLKYTYLPEEKDEYQHMYNYLDESQIERFAALSEEEIQNTKNAKTLTFFSNVNIDQLQFMNYPIEKTIKEMCDIAGLEYTKANDDNADLKLFINFLGSSLFGKTRFYGKVNRTVHVSREVQLNGSVLLKTSNNAFVAREVYRHKKFTQFHYDAQGNQSWDQIINGYWDLYRFNPIIKEVSELLTHALDIDPIQFYIDLSKSENTNSSWWAINLMGNYQNDEALTYLIDWHQKEEAKRKANALNSIGKMNTAESLEFLKNEYDKTSAANRTQVARLYFTSLIDTDNEQAYEIIADAFINEPEAIQIQATRALGKIADEECVKLMLNKFDKSSKKLIENIISALGKCKNDMANPKLTSLLKGMKSKKEWKKSYRKKITELTIDALGEIGSMESFLVIAPYIKDVQYKREAYWALVNITGEKEIGSKYKDWMAWWNENNKSL